MTEGLLEQYDSLPTYEEALDTISSLITKRIRADGTNKGDQFDLMLAYLKILELEDSLSRLKVIHVAGTKGKGSTCTFTESILRACGFHTGLFTSPHLIDLRERFQIDGVEISEEIFLAYFWWCWNRLKEKTNDDVPMPTYFRFLALLAFKIFAAEQVDVAILEVGLGGKFDATNVVQSPVVCGISSLGFDHMEILGNTLGEIAGEKAGIFKRGVPAFTAPQLEEAMSVLQIKASQLDVPLQIAPPLDSMPDGIQLGLAGEHQYINAGLAVALCRTWLQRTEHLKGLCLYETSGLPEQFVKGLATASLQGRAQIVPDPHMGMENKSDRGESRCSLGELIFYLDGAHSPESTDVCARWFSHAVQKDLIPQSCQFEHITRESSGKNSKQILLFNCMSVRDPLLLLPHLKNTCALNGIHFHKAIFVPNQSVFNKVGSHALPSTDPLEVDLSWQLTLQKVWEDLTHGDIGSHSMYETVTLLLSKHVGRVNVQQEYPALWGSVYETLVSGASGNRTMDSCSEEKRETEPYIINVRENSSVFASLPLALKWLRETAQRDQSTHFQVLVTGSLHLVGDMLRLIKK